MGKQEQGGPKNDDRGLSGYIESEHQGLRVKGIHSGEEKMVKVDRYSLWLVWK